MKAKLMLSFSAIAFFAISATKMLAGGNQPLLPKLGTDGAGAMGVQPLKYGAKELDRENGLDWYDFHALQMDPMVPRFTSIDKKAEDYYSISPYAHCAANPIKFIDPDGTTIVITGDLKNEGYRQLDLSTSLTLSMDKSGLVSSSGKPTNDYEKILLSAITDEKNVVILFLTNDQNITGGSFEGSRVVGNKVVATQKINPNRTIQFDEFYQMPIGVSTLHDVMECYIGAVETPGATSVNGTTDEQGNSIATSKEYLNAHSKAKLADPRFVEPDISLDRNTGFFYINDKEKESVLK